MIKGHKKKPNKSVDIFLCLNPRFWGQKWVLACKIHFPSLFILWSKVEKRIENIENDVLKKVSFLSFIKNISAIIVLRSYYIFNNRNTETWYTPSEYIVAPMLNMWIMWLLSYMQTRNHSMPAGRPVKLYTPIFLWGSPYYFIVFKLCGLKQ